MKDTGRTENLASLIDEITEKKTLHDIYHTLIDQLTRSGDKNLFRFDYAIIAAINPINNKISGQAGARSEKQEDLEDEYRKRGGRKNYVDDPELWMRSNNRRLDESDVVCLLTTNKKIKPSEYGFYKVVENKIDDIIYPIGGRNSVFDQYIYERHRHHDLIRFFFPIVFRNDQVTHDDYEMLTESHLGLLEVGFHTSGKAQIELTNFSLLRVYCNYLAQIINNANIEKVEQLTLLMSGILQKKSPSHRGDIRTDHTLMADLFAEKVMGMMSINMFEISFLSLEDKWPWVPQFPRAYGELESKDLITARVENDNKNRGKKEGIYRKVRKDKRPYISNNVLKDPFYIPGVKDSIKSQLSVPIKYRGHLLGIISAYSDGNFTFNNYMLKFLSKTTQDFGLDFVRARLLSYTKLLAIPLSPSGNKYDVFDKVLSFLTDYFQVRRMAIFERVEDEYKYSKGTSEFDDLLSNPSVCIAPNTIASNSFVDFGKTSDLLKSDINSWVKPFLNDGKSKYYIQLTASQHQLDGLKGSSIILVMFVNLNPKNLILEDMTILESIANKLGSTLLNSSLNNEIAKNANKIMELIRPANIGNLVIGFAHDANHVLSGIKQNITSLQTFIPFQRREEERYQRVDNDLKKGPRFLSQVFNSLIKVSSKDTFAPEVKNFKSIMDELAEIFRIVIENDKHTSFSYQYSADQGSDVKCDKFALWHIFFNLTKNSLYSINSSQVKTGKINLSIKDLDSEMFRISFQDNGPGIDPQFEKHLFNETWSNKGKDGSGLGLMLIKNLVDKHGGQIGFHNNHGASMKFIIDLPKHFNG